LEAGLDLNGFCFAAGAAALAAVACTILPGWSATRTPLDAALRQDGARLSLSRRDVQMRSAFTLAQAAVTVVLLVMASLLVLSYRSMMSADTGFANRDAVSMNLQLRGFDEKPRRLFYGQLLSRLREAPGVTSAAAVLVRPLEGPIGWDRPYEFEFEAGGRSNRVLPKVNYEVVTPDYFKTVGTALVEGRDFDDHDTEAAEPVVIISRTLAQRIRAAGHSPLGTRIRPGPGADWSKIVGVCSDARYRSITQPGEDIFAPYTQAPQRTNYVIIMGTRSTEDLASLVRSTLAGIDSNQAVASIATIGELIDTNAARHRFNMILLVWFGVCAAVLAAAGVYSVTSESMAAREREIAIRTALGSQGTRLVRDMVSRTLWFVLIGEVLGVSIISALGKLYAGLLYGVSARDPLILGSVVTFLFIVSMGASVWPAWSATNRDPQPSLRAG
jgi:putative ABC transport system permease protein